MKALGSCEHGPFMTAFKAPTRQGSRTPPCSRGSRHSVASGPYAGKSGEVFINPAYATCTRGHQQLSAVRCLDAGILTTAKHGASKTPGRLCGRMATLARRLLVGTMHHLTRLHHTISERATPFQRDPFHDSTSWAGYGVTPGNRVTSRERGYRRITPNLKRVGILKPVFRCTQKKSWFKTDSGLASLESHTRSEQIQDASSEVHLVSDPTPRLICDHRSKGDLVLDHLRTLELRTNLRKSVLLPCQRTTFLGVDMDSRTMRARLSPARVQYYRPV